MASTRSQRALAAKLFAWVAIASLTASPLSALAADGCSCHSFSRSTGSRLAQVCSCTDDSSQPTAAASVACKPEADGRCSCNSGTPRSPSHSDAAPDFAACASGCCETSADPTSDGAPQVSPGSCACQITASSQDCVCACGTLVIVCAAPVSQPAVDPPAAAGIAPESTVASPTLLLMRPRDRSPPCLT